MSALYSCYIFVVAKVVQIQMTLFEYIKKIF